jgi:hypothetical protein
VWRHRRPSDHPRRLSARHSVALAARPDRLATCAEGDVCVGRCCRPRASSSARTKAPPAAMEAPRPANGDTAAPHRGGGGQDRSGNELRASLHRPGRDRRRCHRERLTGWPHAGVGDRTRGVGGCLECEELGAQAATSGDTPDDCSPGSAANRRGWPRARSRRPRPRRVGVGAPGEWDQQRRCRGAGVVSGGGRWR